MAELAGDRDRNSSQRQPHGRGVHLRVATSAEEPALTAEAWCQMGVSLAQRRAQITGMGSRQMWEVGDWLVAGEDRAYRHLNRIKVRALAADITGYSRHTLTMAVSVSRKVKPSVRVDGLSWWHHLAVAKLDEAEQAVWLARAAEQEWSVRQLREQLNASSSPRPRIRATRLIGELVKLSLTDLPESARTELYEWWARQTSPPLTA